MSNQGPYTRPGYGGGGGATYSAPGGYQGYGGGSAAYAAPSPQGGYNSNMAPAGSMYSHPVQNQSNLDEDSNNKTSKSGKKSLAVQALNQNVLMWAGFFTFTIFVYYVLSGKDFSFLMTYGSMARMFGFGILNVKTFKSQKATGTSAKSLQLYCIVFFCRLTSILQHEGYLPYDKSGDWLYHVIEFFALFFSASALYGCLGPFKSTYQKELDTFGEFNVPDGFGIVYLVVPVFLLALIVHPNLNNDFMSDVAWVFAAYLETVALIPQLYLFQKMKNGVVELLTAHFVAALGFGRLIEFFFWLYSYKELITSSGSKMPGYISILSQLMQMVLMIDFFWLYFQAVKNATPLVLPSQGSLAGIV